MPAKRCPRLLLVLIVGVALTAGFAPQTVSASPPPALAGVTVVSGSRTGSVFVSVPQAASVSIQPSAKSIAGNGRAAGALLVAVDPGPKKRTTYALTRIAFCAAAGCVTDKTRSAEFAFYDGDYDDEELRVPAGRYVLYVIADGAPVSVTMKFRGLAGSTRITPTGPADFGVGPPPVAITEGTTGAVYSAGKATDMSGPGSFSLSALRIASDNWAAGPVTTCLYDRKPPQTVGFGPGCPAGQNFVFLDAVVSVIPQVKIYGSAAGRDGPGVLGHGAWFAAAASIDAAESMAFQLDFDELDS